MKTPSRTNLYLPIAAMILTAALADPASAQTSCLDSGPGCFKGIFQGQGAHPGQPPGATTVAIKDAPGENASASPPQVIVVQNWVEEWKRLGRR